MSQPGADPIEASRIKYDRMARYYAPLIRVTFLGQVGRLYRAAAAALDVPPGGALVELGCGPAIATRHFLARLDPASRIVGVDLSGEMLVRARARAQRAGWANVSFERGSAHTWSPPRPVDAVVISLALTIFPEPLRCIDRVLGWLRPGGQLVVLDSFLIPGRRFANWMVRAKAPAVGADPEAVPFDALLARLEAPQVTSLFGGAYTLVAGRAARG